MNKTYRSVWSAARGAYIVAHEKASAHGKPSSTRTVVAQAVTAAMLTLGAGQAVAAAVGQEWTTGSINNSSVISGTQAGVEALNQTITGSLINSGTINGGGNTAIKIENSQITGGITNSGTLTGTGYHYGISISSSTLTGSIINSGLIAGKVDAANGSGVVVGGFTNSGTIDSFVRLDQVAGNVINTGTINSSGDGLKVDSQVSGFVSNAGTISTGRGDALVLKGTIAQGVINTGILQTDPGYVTDSEHALLADYAVILGGTAIDIRSGTVTGAIGGGGIKIYNSEVTGGTYSVKTAASAVVGDITMEGSQVSGQLSVLSTRNGTAGTNVTLSGSDGLLALPVATSTISGNLVTKGDGETIRFAVGAGGTLLTPDYINPKSAVLSLGGSASFASGTVIDLRLAETLTINNSSTLAGLITATSIAGDSTLLTRDNSVLHDFTLVSNGTTLSAVVGAATGCNAGGSVIASSVTGPCFIGFDRPSLTVDSGATLTGAMLSGFASAPVYGILALPGAYTGSITNSGFITVSGTNDSFGIRLESAAVTGNIVNDGVVATSANNNGSALSLYDSTLVGSIVNNAGKTLFAFNDGAILVSRSTVAGGITNSGTVEDSAWAAIAVESRSLVSGGIHNKSGGTITGDSYGIVVSDTSTVTGGLTNSGLISGASSGGIVIYSGSLLSGGLTNNSGTITGLTGIYVSGAINGGITNTGLISGDTNGLSIGGVDEGASGVLTTGLVNGVAGTITGGVSAGVIVQNGSSIAGSLTNSGLIQGNNNGIVVVGLQGNSDDATQNLYSSITGSIINSSHVIGTLDAGIWLDEGGIVQRIVNESTITGGNGDESAGIRINGAYGSTDGSTISFAIDSKVTAGITNSGLITASGTDSSAAAIVLKTGGIVSGGLTNSGTIRSGTSGVLVQGYQGGSYTSGDYIENNAYSSITGGIVNRGAIIGDTEAGVWLNNGGIVDRIINESVVVNSSTITGTISGSTGIRISGVDGSSSGSTTVYAIYSSVTGGITNSGLIQGTDGSGIDISAAFIGGGIVNNASGTISSSTSGPVAIHVSSSSISGGISNRGLISGDSAAIRLYYSEVSNGITNYETGVIEALGNAGSGVAIDLTESYSTLSGGINNLGLISGADVGISVNSHSWISGGLTNSGASATISGNIAITVGSTSTISGGITNSGKILGVTSGIRVASSSSVTGGITSSGTIGVSTTVSGGDAYATGINVTLTGTIEDDVVNSGTISVSATSTDNDADAYGIKVASDSAVVGSLTNSGTITAIALAGDSGTAWAAGIEVNSSSVVTGSIINTGTIAVSAIVGSYGEADSFGIRVADNSTIDSIINIGTITATASTTGDEWDADFDGRGIRVTESSLTGMISNSGLISTRKRAIYIDEAVIGEGLTNTGTITTLGNGAVVIESSSLGGGVLNSGLIDAYGDGIVILSTMVTGSISNSGTIVSRGNDYVIKIDNDSTISGGIVNSGTLSTGDDKAVYLSGNSLVESGLRNSGLIRSASSTAVIIQGGATLSGGLVNTGTISAGDHGIKITSSSTTVSGDLTNSGLISAGSNNDNAVDIYWATLDGALVNSGTLSGSKSGINAEGNFYIGTYSTTKTFANITGGIANSGLIAANRLSGSSAYGIRLKLASLEGGLANSGTIAATISTTEGWGQAVGILVEGKAGYVPPSYTTLITTNAYIDGNITNSGLVSATLSAAATSGSAYGLSLGYATVTGALINTGEIRGVSNFSDAVSTVSGSTASGAYGVALNNGATISGGMTNSGTIAATNLPSRATERYAIYTNASSILPHITNLADGLIDGRLMVNSATNVLNQGTVALSDGNSTIAGHFVQEGDGMLSIMATGTASGDYSTLSVGGNVSLAGTLFVDVRSNGTIGGVAGQFVEGDMLDNVITAGGGSIAGTFSGVDTNSLLFEFTAEYNNEGNDVDLNVAPAANISLSEIVRLFSNRPSHDAARLLDELIENNPEFRDLFQNFTTGQERDASDAVRQTLPLMTGGQVFAMLNALRAAGNIIQSFNGSASFSSGDETAEDRRFWAKPFGTWANQDDRNQADGFDAETYGMVFGADTKISDADRLGAAFMYSRTDVDGNSSITRNRADVDSYMLALYGSHAFSASTELTYQLDVGHHNTEGERNVDLLLPGVQAKSDFDSWSAHFGLGLAHSYQLTDKTSLTPSVRMDYTRVDNDSYREKDAGILNLRVNDSRTEELILSVDGKLTHALSDRATFTANLGVGYDVMKDESRVTSVYAGAPGASFTTEGIDPAAWMVRGGLGIVGNVTESLEVTARYDFDLREDYDNQSASVKLRWAF